MRPPLLVLRPEPGAAATVARAEAAGWRAIAAPLFKVTPCEWDIPEPNQYDALMLTSAAAIRNSAPGLNELLNLPVYAVGAATAAAATAAGFADVRTGDRDAAVLLDRAAADGITRLLHLAGRDHRAASHPTITIDRRIVYRADPVAALPAAALTALAHGAIVLLHSPRAAATFAALLDRAGLGRAATRLAAISPAALAAAGTCWQASAAAERPDDDALLAAAAGLCD